MLRLQAMYAAEGSAFEVEEIAGGYQLLTRAEFHPWLARLRSQGGDAPLSAAARDADDRRLPPADHAGGHRGDPGRRRGGGAASTHGTRPDPFGGRDDTLGRPALYETTRKFLLHFGLRSLRDLPPVEEKHRVAATHRE